MAAAASMSSTVSGNGPAASGPDEDSEPKTGARAKTLDDIRNKTTEIERPLGILPQATAEQIQTLQLARKEILEFYSSVAHDTQIEFLSSGHLECYDPELWLELVEVNFERIAGSHYIADRFRSFLKYDGPEILSRICREIICTSSLTLGVKLAFLASDDLELRQWLLKSEIEDADIIKQQTFKRYLLEQLRFSDEKAFWYRTGVLNFGVYGGRADADDLKQLSPKIIADGGINALELSSLRLDKISDRGLENLTERLTLLPENIVASSQARQVISGAKEDIEREATSQSEPETELLWRNVCSDVGIATPFTLQELAEAKILSWNREPHLIESFLTWCSNRNLGGSKWTAKQIADEYKSNNQVTDGDSVEVLATVLGQDSLTSKNMFLFGSEKIKPLLKFLIKNNVPIPVPNSVEGFSLIYERFDNSLKPWIEKNQDDLLTLLQKSLSEFESEPTSSKKRDQLQDIHAGVLFLRDCKPIECAEMLSRIIEFDEYTEFLLHDQYPHRAVVNAAYHKVISIPKDELTIHDEAKLYDSNRLYWTVPAGRRWIFMEGLEAPKHEILAHACILLHDTLSKELRVDCTERHPKTDSLERKIEKTRERLNNIDPALLTETEQIFHAAILPLFNHLSLWANGDKSDIRMIVEIERSGLARPADPTDKVRIAPGTHYDFLQKKHVDSAISSLSRECPVLDPERFKRNLLEMAKISTKTLSNKPIGGYGTISPRIPSLKLNPVTLFKLSGVLNEDNRYLTESLCSRMESDYSFAPILEGALADFLTTIEEDETLQPVTLTADFAGNGSILPRPHHSRLDPESIVSLLKGISIGHHPDGSAHVQGASGFAELSVNLQVSGGVLDLDLSQSCSQVQANLSPDIYQQLTNPISTLEELPVPLQHAIKEARSMPVVQAALYLETFVRANYIYSFDVAHSEAYRKFHEQRAEGFVHGENAYLKMIHALGDDKCLGKGVCGQLSTVLFASLRLARVPCLMTRGYLASSDEIDENMSHAYVSALLPGNDGVWKLKVLEATGGGFEGWIALQTAELERLRSAQTPATAEQRILPRIETNKWAWLAAELRDSILNLTNQDADIFYSQVMTSRGIESSHSPSSMDVADAYGAVIGSSDDLVNQLDGAFLEYPRLQIILEIAKSRRSEIIKTIEASLPDDFEIDGSDNFQ